MRTGKVILAGTGCGDIELMTVKAVRRIQECNALVYDHLIPPGALAFAPPDCEKIYVGKEPGRHSVTQDQINALLIEKAREGKTVVRLKGGDPFVFGRGGEEFLALMEAEISCEAVPGISSAIAVPALAGIPVTHRGLCSGVTILTAATAEDGGHAMPKLDFEALAKLDTTLVFLMGMRHLDEIARRLTAAGKSPETPAAVIMEGTTERQKSVRAPLMEIAEKAKEAGLHSPAVIVVGATAGLCLVNAHSEEAALRVAVTGTLSFSKRFRAAAEKAGVRVIDRSFLNIAASQERLPGFSSFEWFVFTSPNGVTVFLEKLRRERRDLRCLAGNKIAVIGPSTARALEEAGLFSDYMPEVYDSVHLAEGLTKLCQKSAKPALFLRAYEGARTLPESFQGAGLPFTDFPLYRIGVDEKKREGLCDKTEDADYVVFGSALGVRTYFEAGLYRKDCAQRCVCIGRQCAGALEKYGVKPYLIAEEATVDGLLQCLLSARK